MHAALGPPLRRARRRLGRWLDHLAPRGCATCGAWLAPGAFPGFCPGCLVDLPGARRPRCARCGQPTDRPAAACTACVGADPGPGPIEATLAAADYSPPLDRVVTELKFGHRLALARPLGELLAARWLGALPAVPLDGLVPVPLADRRLAQRGFNPSLEMAHAMSAALPSPLPVLPGRLRRVRETPPQSGLDLAERRRNLHGCFACDVRLDGLRIGLVDDVMTSGSTVAEAARTLRAAGAASVVAIVVARTA
ncbi:MAG: ComF family protein [Burkholderiales bacterium]|jgi:ComF family protein